MIKNILLRFLVLVVSLFILAPCLASTEKTKCAVLSETFIKDWAKNSITSEQLIKAKEVCLKLAEQGDPEAQYHFGGLHTVHIDNIYPNESEMWKWMKLSAKNGYAKAQGFLGRSYETDKNFLRKKEISLAIKWHTLAAKQHDIASMVRLEELYRKGLLGVQVDIKKANYWAEEMKKGQ